MLAVASGNDILLYSAELQLIAEFHGHTDEVLAVSWSSDGTKLASASKDQTVQIWDVKGSTLAVLTDLGNWVTNVNWSPSGDKLATTFIERIRTFSDGNGYIFFQTKIWDMNDSSNPQLLYELPQDVVDDSNDLTWKPDASQFVTAGNFQRSEYAANIWNVRDGQLQITVSGFYDNRIYSVDWSPMSDTLAIASDTTVYIADPSTGQITTLLTGHNDLVSDLAWNADGIRLASGSHDRTIRIWDTRSAQTLVLIQNDEKVFSAKWNQNGDLLASLDKANTLKIWDVPDIPMKDNAPKATALPTWIPTSVNQARGKASAESDEELYPPNTVK